MEFWIISSFVGFLLGGGVALIFLQRSGVSSQEFEALKSEERILRAKLEDRENTLLELKAVREAKERELVEAKEEAAALRSERAGLAQRIETHKDDLKQMEERFRVEFQNIAQKIFEEKANTFKTQSSEALGHLLNPLKEKIGSFQEQVQKAFHTEAKERHSLKSEIERIASVNEKMTRETENLTQALKGDVKAQGTWGEVVLEKILAESGLRKDEDYVVQGKDLGMKHPETGRPLKPDVVVKLPDEKHIIIDSKVTLDSYRKYCETDEAEQELHLKAFIQSMKAHVKGLEERRYQDTEGLGTPDFVLMFMPIEGAYSLALQAESELHEFAWGKRIVIVSPTTLFVTLRTIAQLWNIEAQNKNALAIAQESGKLYDKFVGFLEDMEKLGSQLQTTQRTYNDAFNKLSAGKGNLIGKTEKLRELGAKASKSIKSHLIDQDEEGAERVAELAKPSSSETFVIGK